MVIFHSHTLFQLLFPGLSNYPSTLFQNLHFPCPASTNKMKSAVLAVAAAAVVASAHEARAPLDLGLKVPGLVDLKLCLGLDVELPAGISIESEGCPSGPPAEDQTNVWHPPHHVPMDGCDDNGNNEWHYVHPCDCQAPAPHTWGTSTVTQTHVSTIISCAPTVTNCPNNGAATTVIVPATTFICPVPVTSTTLATVPATNTLPATQPAATWTQPANTQAPPPANTQTQPATAPGTVVVPGTVPANVPGTVPANVPGTLPATQAPASPAATTPVEVAPPATAPAVVAPPATTPCPESSVPVVVVPPPAGTGFPPSGNWTQPPAIAGASQTSQRVGAVVAMGLAAALFI